MFFPLFAFRLMLSRFLKHLIFHFCLFLQASADVWARILISSDIFPRWDCLSWWERICWGFQDENTSLKGFQERCSTMGRSFTDGWNFRVFSNWTLLNKVQVAFSFSLFPDRWRCNVRDCVGQDINQQRLQSHSHSLHHLQHTAPPASPAAPAAHCSTLQHTAQCNCIQTNLHMLQLLWFTELHWKYCAELWNCTACIALHVLCILLYDAMQKITPQSALKKASHSCRWAWLLLPVWKILLREASVTKFGWIFRKTPNSLRFRKLCCAFLGNLTVFYPNILQRFWILDRERPLPHF